MRGFSLNELHHAYKHLRRNTLEATTDWWRARMRAKRVSLHCTIIGPNRWNRQQLRLDSLLKVLSRELEAKVKKTLSEPGLQCPALHRGWMPMPSPRPFPPRRFGRSVAHPRLLYLTGKNAREEVLLNTSLPSSLQTMPSTAALDSNHRDLDDSMKFRSE